MTTETWLGILIFVAIVIVIWEILKGVYKKIRRKINNRKLRSIKKKYKPNVDDYVQDTEHTQTTQTTPIPKLEGNYNPKQLSNYT